MPTQEFIKRTNSLESIREETENLLNKLFEEYSRSIQSNLQGYLPI